MTEKKKTTKEKDKKWIKKAVKNPGAFTAKAKRKGITTAQLQANVEKNPDKYDEKTQKQAKLRETLVRINKDKKNKNASKEEK
jgi:tripartite-type tricarboxylate transporter receptor subunit TctC